MSTHTLTMSATGMMKILPSPTSPVCAAFVIVRTTESTCSLHITNTSHAENQTMACQAAHSPPPPSAAFVIGRTTEST